MSVNKNSYYGFQASRASTGRRSAILVKDTDLGKYTLLFPANSLPSVEGSVETTEFTLLNSPAKGKIETGTTLEDGTFQILYHRDNIYRFNKFRGKVLDLMTVNDEFVGEKITGTISMKRDEAGEEATMATITVVPMSKAEMPNLDVRAECIEPLYFDTAIPDEVKVGEEVLISVSQKPSGINYRVRLLNPITYVETETTDAVIAAGTKDTDNMYFSATATGLYVIQAYDSTNTYAPWETTVAVVSTEE